MRNEPFRLRYANQIVGAFLLLALVGSTLLVVPFARETRFFTKTVKFNSTLREKDAADLRKDTEVVVLGRTIGRVESIDYVNNSDKVRVVLTIYADESHLITTSSVLSLERKFGVGAMYIKVSRSSQEPNAKEPDALPAGGNIALLQDKDQLTRVGDSVDAIKNSATPALDSVKTASDSLSNAIDPIALQGQETLESVKVTSELLQLYTREMTESVKILTKLMQHFVESDLHDSLQAVIRATDSAKAASDNFAKTSESLDKKTDKTNEDIRQTLATMRETLLTIQKLTNESREVVQVMRGEAKELPGTTAKINDTVDDTQDLVQQIRSHWILRGTRGQASGSEPIKPSSIRAEGPR